MLLPAARCCQQRFCFQRVPWQSPPRRRFRDSACHLAETDVVDLNPPNRAGSWECIGCIPLYNTIYIYVVYTYAYIHTYYIYMYMYIYIIYIYRISHKYDKWYMYMIYARSRWVSMIGICFERVHLSVEHHTDSFCWTRGMLIQWIWCSSSILKNHDTLW